VDFLSLHQSDPDTYPFLLESLTAGTGHGCYDVLFGHPQSSLSYHYHADRPVSWRFLDALDVQWQRLAPIDEPATSTLPYDGGYFLYLGYELAAQIEPVLNLPEESSGLPTSLAVRCPMALIRDHSDGQVWYLVADDYRDRAEIWQAQLLEQLLSVSEHVTEALGSLTRRSTDLVIEEEDPDRFLAAVAAVKEYILAGDVFQVNLARQWCSDLGVDPVRLYRHLRHHNPAPFAGLMAFEDHCVLSSSPERLVSVRDQIVSTRPIAGTHPREAGDDDASIIEALRQHPKEVAEHIMLIDLERNDLGRICEPGSVEVDELMSVESYTHVHHIVSNVRGRLKDGCTPGEVITAVFPGGTITGCPKVRCMQIIAELEQRGRGAYTGAMGYLNVDGSMDLNILIRTLQVTGHRVKVMAGGGLVADSEPQRELDETRSKARGMLMALTASQQLSETRHG